MIKSIFSFFASGFFRKLGQIAALIVVGLIALVLFNNSNIKLPRFLQFGLVHVNASTVDITNKNYRIRTCYNKNSGECSWVSGSNSMGTAYSLSRGTGTNDKGILDAVMARATYTGNFQGGITYRLSINLQASAKLNKRALREVICGGIADPSDWTSNQDLVSKCEITGIVSYDSGNKTSYYVDFIPLTNFKGIQIQIYFYQPIDTITSINMLSSTNIQVDTSTQDAINNQTTIINQNFNETNNNINAINDTLNDTDVSDDVDDAGDFFNDFELSSDTPLTNILMMPLTFINLLLNYDSTSDFCTTYHSKQICLPNGSLIWGRSDSLVVAFKSFFNLVIGGFLFYRLLRFTAKTIENALDPTIVSEVSKEL